MLMLSCKGENGMNNFYDPTMKTIDECLETLSHKKALPTIDLICELSGLKSKAIIEAITQYENRYRKEEECIFISIQDIETWLRKNYVLHIAYRYVHSKKPKSGDKLEMLCEDCGLTVEELHEYVHKYPSREQEYYMLRGAIRNFLERQENTAEEEAYHIPSVAIVENLHVKFLDDGLGNSVHTLYVSESLRDENAFTISRIRRFEAEVPNDKNVVFTRNLPIAEEKATRHLDEAGVAKAGEYLEEGDIVIGCCLHCKPTTQEELLLAEIFHEKTVLRDKSIYVPKNISGTVIDVKIKSRAEGDELKSGVKKKIFVRMRQDFPLQIGDILTDSTGVQGIVAGFFEQKDRKEQLIANFPFNGECVIRDCAAQEALQSRGIGPYSYSGRPMGTCSFAMPQALTVDEILKLTRAGYFSVIQDMLLCNDSKERVRVYRGRLTGEEVGASVCMNDNLRRLFSYLKALGGDVDYTRLNDIKTAREISYSFKELCANGFETLINGNISLSIIPSDGNLEDFEEVVRPETINYYTEKPVTGGLFCERIFGAVTQLECHCGKYQGIRYRGKVCEKCGVKVEEDGGRDYKCSHIAIDSEFQNPLFQNKTLHDLLVFPPKFRPICKDEDERWISENINFCYRRIINNNNRSKRMRESGAPQFIVENEQKMLKKAVDDFYKELFVETYDWIHAAFFNNRADYSASAAVSVNYDLTEGACKLPYKIGMEMYKPIIMRLLIEKKIVHNARSAKRFVENNINQSVITESFNTSYSCGYKLLALSPAENSEVVVLAPTLFDGIAIEISLQDWLRLGLQIGESLKLFLPPTKYAQRILSDPVQLDETFIDEFEHFLRTFSVQEAMSPRQKKEYIIRTIEHINKTQRFINCLPFCFLSGRRATEDERKLCNEEIAQVNQNPAQDGEMVNILFDNDGTGQRKDDGQNDEKDADSLFDDLFNDDEH